MSPEDIFVFKSITDRPADEDDVELIHAQGVDWQAILMEMRWQSEHSATLWSPIFAQSMQIFADAGRTVSILRELVDLANRDADRYERAHQRRP